MSGEDYSDEYAWDKYDNANDDDYYHTNLATMTTTAGVAPTTAPIGVLPPAPGAPQVMVPYGFIALALAAILLFMGLRNVRSGAPKKEAPLSQKLARAPDSYQNDESSEDEFLN